MSSVPKGGIYVKPIQMIIIKNVLYKFALEFTFILIDPRCGVLVMLKSVEDRCSGIQCDQVCMKCVIVRNENIGLVISV